MRFVSIMLLIAGLCLASSAIAKEPTKSWADMPSYIPLNWETTTAATSTEDGHAVSETLNIRFHTFYQNEGPLMTRVMDNKCLWNFYHKKPLKGWDSQCEVQTYNVLAPLGFNMAPTYRDIAPSEIVRLTDVIAYGFVPNKAGARIPTLEFAIFDTKPDRGDMQKPINVTMACVIDPRGSAVVGMGTDITCPAHTQKFTRPNDGKPICVSTSLCHRENLELKKEIDEQAKNCKCKK